MDVTFLETEMFFSPHNTHSSIQGETWTNDQNWVSENWIHWDSKGDSEVGDPDVGYPEHPEVRMRGDPAVGDPKHPKVGVRGDLEVEVRGDPEVEDLKSRELGEQIDSDGQTDSNEREETNETPLSHKVHDQTFENIHEVQTLNSSNDSGRYMLPFRYN